MTMTKAEIYDPEWMAEVSDNLPMKPWWDDATERSRAGGHESMPFVPAIPNIHSEVFEAASAPDALYMYEWHTCDTTHCRAGWVVHLAGEAGYALEHRFGTSAAALLIYRASDPETAIFPWMFLVHEEDALADMRACAEREAAR